MNRKIWLVVGVVALALAVVVLSKLLTEAEDQGSPEETNFTGVVTDIESTGLNEVSTFEVRHDGITTTVYVRADYDYGFPLGHLQAHLTSGDPVIVSGEVVDGKLYADSIEDA